MYSISLRGAELHHYAAEAGIPASHGWSAVDGLWGRRGDPVRFDTRSDAEGWMRDHGVFCGGAEVAEATAPSPGGISRQHRASPPLPG